ncbi:Uncharacterized protein dnl_32750 [Desulfonema limicola]|uniref:Phasin family protein n=1 Tax=Desulfonema limicola TaxID=45656 RepID=A0A975B8S2_9BACT|nr:hypothetical protein [Desulfonema limicola]QTA80958.1 Uncharacterized protein dnl_32750 [Desulfonema limicola]
MLNLQDQNQFLQKMTDFQKTAMESSLKTMEIGQTRMENMMQVFLKHSEWTVEKWQGAMSDWTKIYQQGYESFAKAAENNFSKVEKFMNKS